MIFNYKTVIATVSLIFALTISNAQDKPAYDQGFRFGVGINAGYPFEDPYTLNLGADARFQYDLSQKYSLTFTTGFSNLFVKNGPDLGYIPAKVGFKAFVIEDQFYLMGEVGGAFAVTNSNNAKSVLISPSIGYVTKNFDFSVRYEYLPDFATDGLNQVSLRVAYGFKL